MAPEADYTFLATDCDHEKGGRACRGLAEAFAAGREPRSEEVREAIASATAAFPGLQEFVDSMDERDLDPEDAMMDVRPGPARARPAGARDSSEARIDWRHDPSG